VKMWSMKKFIAVALLLAFAESISAQTFTEWFNQNATQKKYLIQQIAALQMYIGYFSKGYSIVKKGLNTIQDIKHGNYNLHSSYFTSLVTVNLQIKRYTKVADIITLQISITKQTARTIKNCKNSHLLTLSESAYLQKVFNSLLDDCTKCLDALFNIITNKLYFEMVDKQVFTRSFCNAAEGLCLQRNNEQRDLITSKKLNGLK
jgi:hypothetical protein